MKLQAENVRISLNRMNNNFSGERTRFVILHGGAGNQLFQWAYAHFLHSLGHEVRCLFVNKKYLIQHASICISDFVEDCYEIKIEQIDVPKNILLGVLKDPTHRKNPISLLTKNVSNNLKTPFEFNVISKLGKYNLGYYQNFEVVYLLREHLLSHLEKSLYNTIEPDINEAALYGSQIIHVRQGDTMTLENRRRVGVLNTSYYESLKIDKSSPVFVLTDDVKGAKNILGSLKVDGFYGPNDLDVAATLRVMSKSSRLYCANSTLAWWGGVLAEKNGGEVYIPDPFFLNISPKPGVAFLYPGFRSMQSKFLG